MTIANGTRQGAILSPVFWAIYADPMLGRLRRLGLGAHVAGCFMGAVCYADDVLLIAPTRNSMQRMLLELEEFASENNITFSTDPIPSLGLEWGEGQAAVQQLEPVHQDHLGLSTMDQNLLCAASSLI